MKLNAKPILLKLLSLAAAALGLLLYTILYATGVDSKGLLVEGHWTVGALWSLTGGILLILFVLTRSITGFEDYTSAHPDSLTGALGAWAACAALVYTTVSELGSHPVYLTALSLAGALCLAFIGFCRLRSTKPHFLTHGLLCLLFALRMISQYQRWNSDPQILDYAFYLMAYVALMLTAYQHAAWDSGMGKQRNLWCLSLCCVYLCLVCLYCAPDFWLLLSCSIWVLTNLTNLEPPREVSV